MKNVPALPNVVKECLDHLNAGELDKAAIVAKNDQKLVVYLKKVVNSAAYSFKSTLEDEKQIFSALGTHRAKQLVFAYMIDYMSPNRWDYFKLDSAHFKNFQIEIIKDFNHILRSFELEKSEYQSASSIICATVVVADQIFGDHKEDVAIIRQSQDLSLDGILKRISGYTFANLVTYIGKLWEVDASVLKLLELSFGHKQCSGDVCDLAKMMHLLLFKIFSKQLFIEAGLNDFLELKVEFVQDIYPRFSEVFDETGH